MRFLSRDWIEGALDEFTTDLYHGVYIRHLMEIARDLPEGARTLALTSQGMLLAGSRVIATQIDEAAKTFTLILKVQGHDAEHYLQLEYEGVDAETCELEPLHFAATCLSEEFDVGPEESFEHRILLAPEGEAVIRFKNLRFHSKRNDDE